MLAVEMRSLTKRFGGRAAVDGVTLSVEEGEIFGFLGPNGAGKSTTMMILTTLLRPTSGSASVAGHDVATERAAVRRSIGCVQQEMAADEFLSGRENLVLSARLNRVPAGSARRRVDEALSLVELEERQHDPVLTYSGGMRKRLEIACGLMHRPRVLFLDEPTVGLDIQTRRRIWEYVRGAHREYGATVFLSTHYMEEADSLCGRVAIMDRGSVRAEGRPSDLKAAAGPGSVRATVEGDAAAVARRLGRGGALGAVEADGSSISAPAADGPLAAGALLEAAREEGARVVSLSITPPTLEDVFLSHTGRALRDGGAYDARKERRRRGGRGDW